MPNIGGGLGYRPWTLCGAVGRVEYRGALVTSVCTRFDGHLTSTVTREPLKHFDERTKRSWYEEPVDVSQQAACPPCIGPPE